MIARVWIALLVLLATACGAAPDSDGELATSTVSQASTVANGSFETGDYTGWTLLETPSSPQNGTWGIASNNQTIAAGATVFDFSDQVNVHENSPGLPITYHSTDGNFVALQLQNGSQDHRMFQTVAVPSCTSGAAVVQWDMSYNNHFSGFDANSQFIAVNVRSATDDSLLANVFKTKSGDPLVVATMTGFRADLTAFGGQSVRLDFEQNVQLNFFDAAYDNVRINCKNLIGSPSPLDFGTNAVGVRTAPKNVFVQNLGSASFNITSAVVTGPFRLEGGPALPTPLAAGNGLSFPVSYSATAVGPQTGTLTINGDDPTGPEVIQLVGTGQSSAQLSITGSPDFGSVQVGDTHGQSLTLTNTGGTTLTVTSASVPAPFSFSASFPITLTAGQSTSFNITFTPTSPGFTKQPLQLVSNDANSPTVIGLSGTGVAPTLSVSVPALSFGGQRVGTTSAGKLVRVTNTGVGKVTINAASASGAFDVSSASLPITLSAGAFTDFTVRFSPAAEGPATGQLTLTNTAASSPDVVSLDGTGIAPHVSLSPSSVVFGNQRVGTTGQQQIVVSNPGSDTLTVSALATTSPFADADATPFTLAPGASRTLTVSFHPTVEGEADGNLTLTADDVDSPHVIALSGTGVLGKLAIVPGAVHFADQRVGVSSAARFVTITNTGTDAVALFSATLSSGPFSVGALGTSSLAPGGSTQLALTFTPTAPGDASASLTIVSDAPSSPDVVPVSGTGVEPRATVSPGALAFGNQRVGVTSTARTFTLSNPGTSTLTVTALSASGPFAIPSASLPLTIAAGQSATVSVTFTPTVAGPASGTVTITSDATTTPSVSLTGTGTEPLVSASTTTLAFGNQRVGVASAAQIVTLTNTGTAPLSITAATAPPGFAFAPAPALPVTVLPGGHATFDVTFKPTAVGPASGDLVFTSDAASSPTVVAVSGAGVEATLVVDPTAHDFGDIVVGATSAPTTITLSNGGTDALVIKSVTLAAPFARTTALTLPATLAPGASISFDVVFSPTAHASSTGAVAITTDAGFASVTLTGRGVQPRIAASPPAIDFGTVAIGQTLPKSLVLSNPGDSPLKITALAFSGANAADYSIATPPGLPATLAAGASLPLSVVFAPSDHGTRLATLTVTSDAVNTPVLPINLTGHGSGPRAALSASALELGASNVGVTTAPRAVQVTNTGEDPLVVTSIVLGGANATDFATTATLPLTVAPGASASLPFVMTPSAVGARAATATIVTTDPLTASLALALTGTGRSPQIDVAPTSLAFGDVRVGDTSTLSLVVTNPGSGPLTISSIAVSGTDADAVTVVSVTLPLVLQPAASRTLQVTFAPTVLGSASASIVITSDDRTTPTATIPVSGNGVSPSISIDPTSLSFGAQLVGHTSAPRAIHIHNPGTGALTVTALAVTGAQATSFALASPPALPAAIAPGASLDIALAFAPAVVGQHDASLHVTTDSADSPDAVVALTGVGISTAFTVSPSTLAFGTVHPGTASAPVAVTLTNLSDDPIVLTDAVLGGARPGDFKVSSVAGTLAPGGSTSAMVTYAPATATVSAATLTFSATDPAIPAAVVTLSGTASSSFVTVDHPTLDFGTLELGDHSGGKPVAVTNVTGAPITIASIAASDPQFEIDASAATAGPLAPGASVTFTVAFGPTHEGSASAMATITLAGGSGPELAVGLTGVGAARPSEGCDAGGHGAGSALVLAAFVLARRRRRAS